ncbi:MULTISPECIES: hypothetical protein [Streptomyces]|uniref:Integral membrane protein n=1 Tax=Streptomyces virginiae TaxID=1961 RepID=A0ABZ1TPU0_STRVG|nr:hypothetical protein [Streptomyces virginiae]
MSLVKEPVEPEQQTEVEPEQEPVAEPERRGTASLALGATAVAMLGCPFLPEELPPWIRFFPLYLVLPVAIMALVCGLPDLWAMRGDEAAARGRARIGVALGTVATLVPMAACLLMVQLLE